MRKKSKTVMDINKLTKEFKWQKFQENMLTITYNKENEKQNKIISSTLVMREELILDKPPAYKKCLVWKKT